MKSEDDVLHLTQKASPETKDPVALTNKLNDNKSDKSLEEKQDALKNLIAEITPLSKTSAANRPSIYDFMEENGSPAFRSFLEGTVAQFLEKRWGERLDKLVEERVEASVEKEISRLRMLLSKEIGTLPEDL